MPRPPLQPSFYSFNSQRSRCKAICLGTPTSTNSNRPWSTEAPASVAPSWFKASKAIHSSRSGELSCVSALRAPAERRLLNRADISACPNLLHYLRTPLPILGANQSFTTASSAKKKKSRKNKKKKRSGSGGAATASEVSLRRWASPFLLLCHPDKISGSEEAAISAREVNLVAVQTLNMLIDDVESARSLDTPTELKSEYEVEFMVPSGASRNHYRPKRDEPESLFTRRSVCLTFPPATRDASSSAAPALITRAMQEIGKLLKAAGLPVPPSLRGTLNGSSTAAHRFMADELGFADSNRRAGFAIDWEKELKEYEAAVRAMEVDLATLGMTDERRKRQVVAGIISRCRFVGNMSAIDQLVALRRMSLLLEDNFEDLGMEDFGTLWERLIIVLRAERDGEIIDGGDTPEEQLNHMEANRKTFKGESGFKFSLGGDDCVTVTVPSNFSDVQFVHQFKQHLSDFHFDDLELQI